MFGLPDGKPPYEWIDGHSQYLSNSWRDAVQMGLSQDKPQTPWSLNGDWILFSPVQGMGLTNQQISTDSINKYN